MPEGRGRRCPESGFSSLKGGGEPPGTLSHKSAMEEILALMREAAVNHGLVRRQQLRTRVCWIG
jgi:hypothetical protein